MLDINGFDVLAAFELRKITAQVVVITGRDEPRNEERALAPWRIRLSRQPADGVGTDRSDQVSYGCEMNKDSSERNLIRHYQSEPRKLKEMTYDTIAGCAERAYLLFEGTLRIN